MSERPPLLWDIVRMIIKMIIGGFVVIGLVSCGVASIGAAGAAGSKGKTAVEEESEFIYGKEESDNAIVQIDIKGPILTHKPEGSNNNPFVSMSAVTYGYEVKEQLLKAAKDDSVKAVMLFVTTPGGSIVGSDAIHAGVQTVKAAGKPIVAYVDTISASGGVWSTASADKIFADNGSLIGSVGVNFGNIMYFDDPVAFDGGLFSGGITTRNGIKTDFIGAGLGKDLGNPFRPMTDREKNALNKTADDFYQMFLDHVVEHRGMNRTALIEQHGAMIYANKQAEEFSYIDGTKTYQETLAYIGEKIGADGDDWKLISTPKEKSSPFAMFGAKFRGISAEDQLRLQKATACAELKAGPMVMTPRSLVSFCGV